MERYPIEDLNKTQNHLCKIILTINLY